MIVAMTVAMVTVVAMIAVIIAAMVTVAIVVAVIAVPVVAIVGVAAVAYNVLVVTAPVAGISCPVNDRIAPWFRVIYYHFIAVINIIPRVTWW
jgi:hypothetical protein